MSKHQSKQHRENGENAEGVVDQRIAELAELVAAGCKAHVAPSEVREEFEALVEEIRARAGEPAVRPPRQSTTRLRAVQEQSASFEFHSEQGEEGRAVEISGVSRVLSLDDARRVLDAIRSEETTGGGPREDLQRAIA